MFLNLYVACFSLIFMEENVRCDKESKTLGRGHVLNNRNFLVDAVIRTNVPMLVLVLSVSAYQSWPWSTSEGAFLLRMTAGGGGEGYIGTWVEHVEPLSKQSFLDNAGSVCSWRETDDTGFPAGCHWAEVSWVTWQLSLCSMEYKQWCGHVPVSPDGPWLNKTGLREQVRRVGMPVSMCLNARLLTASEWSRFVGPSRWCRGMKPKCCCTQNTGLSISPWNI